MVAIARFQSILLEMQAVGEGIFSKLLPVGTLPQVSPAAGLELGGRQGNTNTWKRKPNHAAGVQGAGLVLGIPRVELGQRALGDPLEHLLGEDPEQLPADVQGLEHRAVLVGPCGEGQRGAGGAGHGLAPALPRWQLLPSLP